MAKARTKSRLKGKMHTLPNNEIRAGMSRMQSKGKLWKKEKSGVKKGERVPGTGTEKPILFYSSIDKARARQGGTNTKAGWLKKIRGDIIQKVARRRKDSKKNARPKRKAR